MPGINSVDVPIQVFPRISPHDTDTVVSGKVLWIVSERKRVILSLNSKELCRVLVMIKGM